MSEFSYRFVSGIAVVLSIVSACSSLYILISWRRLKKIKQNDLLNDYVAYMSISDLLLVLLRGVYLSNPAFKLVFMSEIPMVACKIMAACYQLSAGCSSSWNFIIAAFILLPIIRRKPMFKIAKHKIYHLIFVAVVTFIDVSIPIVNDGYGLTYNDATNYGLSPYECWIVNRKDFITICGPITFYILFSILLLIYTILVIYSRKDESISLLTSQLIWYTTVFICVWAPGSINRYYNIITNSPSFVLTCFANISLHSIGWANAVVWYHYMQPFKSNTEASNDSTQYLVNEIHQLSHSSTH